jgi:hypothetical protein
MLTLNVTNRIIMKITVWLIPTSQRFDNCLLKKFNYTYYFALRNTYNYFPLPNHFLIVVFLLLNGAIFAVNKPIQN